MNHPTIKRSTFVGCIEAAIDACADHEYPLTDDRAARLREVAQTATASTAGDYDPVNPDVSPGCPWTIAFGRDDIGAKGIPVCRFASAFDDAIRPHREGLPTVWDFVIA